MALIIVFIGDEAVLRELKSNIEDGASEDIEELICVHRTRMTYTQVVKELAKDTGEKIGQS